MSSTTDISVGTLYELNQQLMMKEKEMTKEQIDEAFEKINMFFQSNGTYFMLLCHEKRDYTLFRRNGHINLMTENFTAERELRVCLNNRGKIISIDELQDGNFEIWIKVYNDNAYCYYLFPYDEGVIECY